MLHTVISALSFFIGKIYLFFYVVFQNYGLALIGLSLAVTLIIFPLQKLSDSLKLKDDREKARFSPLLDDVKKAYSGATAYYYTRYIHRLYHYHPIKSMRSLGGLLIQIPFFIGAYTFLSYYEPLQGTAFWVFKDLGRPDGLLLGANVLPLLMTAFNIIATNILLLGKPLKDKIQLYVIAGVFLVLLYNSPSALVFYWTFNNLFSLVKTVIVKFYHKEAVFDKAKALRIGEALKKNIYKIDFLLNILLLTAGLFMLWLHYEKGNYEAFYIAYGFFIALCVVNFIVYRNEVKKNRDFGLLLVLIIPCLAAAVFFGIVVFTTKLAGLGGLFGANTTKLGAVSTVFVTSLFLALPGQPLAARLYLKYALLYRTATLALPVILLIGLSINALLFLFAPLAFFSSDPLAVSSNTSGMIMGLFSLFIGGSALFLLVYKVLPSFFKNYFMQFAVFILLGFIIHGFFIVGQYGLLNNFNFTDFHISRNERLLDMVLYLVLFALAFWFIGDTVGRRGLPVIAAVILISSLIFSAVSIYKINTVQMAEGQRNPPPAVNREEFQNQYFLSQAGENIIIIMLDRATGAYAATAFEESPELRRAFEGFTYYPNTVSFFDKTMGGFNLIMGGYPYRLEEVDKRTEKSLKQEERSAFAFMPLILKNYGYQLFGSNLDSMFHEEVDDELRKLGMTLNYDGARFTGLIGTEPESKNAGGDRSLGKSLQLIVTVGLFRLSGTAVKPYIYNEGRWLGDLQYSKTQIDKLRTYYSQLKALPLVSTTLESGNTFLLLYNSAAHDPYAFLPDGSIKDYTDSSGGGMNNINNFPAADRERFGTVLAIVHYYGVKYSLQALGGWFDWMRAHNVYNNTKIIVVSDHGAPYATAYHKGRDEELNMFNALLLVKDFNDNAPLRYDNHFMTNADTPAILLSHLPEGGALKSTGAAAKEENIFMYKIPFQIANHKWNAFSYIKRYELTDKSYFTVNDKKAQAAN